MAWQNISGSSWRRTWRNMTCEALRKCLQNYFSLTLSSVVFLKIAPRTRTMSCVSASIGSSANSYVPPSGAKSVCSFLCFSFSLSLSPSLSATFFSSVLVAAPSPSFFELASPLVPEAAAASESLVSLEHGELILRTAPCVHIVALFFYDAAITFTREVACFGTARQMARMATFLLLANKTISSILYIMGLVSFTPIFPDKVSRSSLSPAYCANTPIAHTISRGLLR